MFYQIFLSPQVKRNLIISNKLVYTRCFTSCRTKKIGKVQDNVKTSWNYNLVPSLLPKKKILSTLAKDSLKIEIENFPLSVAAAPSPPSHRRLMKKTWTKLTQILFRTTIFAPGFNITNGRYAKAEKTCCMKFVITNL